MILGISRMTNDKAWGNKDVNDTSLFLSAFKARRLAATNSLRTQGARLADSDRDLDDDESTTLLAHVP